MRTPLLAAWRVLSRATTLALSAAALSLAACGSEDGGTGGEVPDQGGGLVLPDVPGGAGGEDSATSGTDAGGVTPAEDAAALGVDTAAGDDAGSPPEGDDAMSGGDDAMSGGDDATPGSDSGGGLSTCGQEELTLTVGLIPPSILLLIDRSGSMYDRWSTTMGSVQQMIDATAGQVNLGLMMFPSQRSCSTTDTPQVPISTQGASLVYGAMDAAGTGGETPMGPGVEAAKDYLLNFNAPGDVAMVLVADGKPTDTCMQKCNTCDCDDLEGCSLCGGTGASNCNTFTSQATCPRSNQGCQWEGGQCWSYGAGLLECVKREVEIPIGELAVNGIRTWIVGFAGGFGQAALLKRLATAGGTVNDAPQPNGFFDAGEGAQLGQILGQIQSQMAACRARVNVPAGFAFPTVKINGVTIARDQTRTNGWDWLAPGDLSFFGDACTQAQSAGADVQISFLCK